MNNKPPTALLARRFAGIPAWVALIQLFIGFGWLRAATEKIINPKWWDGTALTGFLDGHAGATIGWYRPFIDVVVAPHILLISIVVVVAQIAAGLGLVLGRTSRSALAIGIFLNLNFVAAGAVSPSVFYLLAQAAVVLWLAEASIFSTTQRYLGIARTVAAVAAVASVPYVSTLEPAKVIEDPALMFAFGGALTVLACTLAVANLRANANADATTVAVPNDASADAPVIYSTAGMPA